MEYHRAGATASLIEIARTERPSDASIVDQLLGDEEAKKRPSVKREDGRASSFTEHNDFGNETSDGEPVGPRGGGRSFHPGGIGPTPLSAPCILADLLGNGGRMCDDQLVGRPKDNENRSRTPRLPPGPADGEEDEDDWFADFHEALTRAGVADATGPDDERGERPPPPPATRDGGPPARREVRESNDGRGGRPSKDGRDDSSIWPPPPPKHGKRPSDASIADQLPGEGQRPSCASIMDRLLADVDNVNERSFPPPPPKKSNSKGGARFAAEG